MATSYARVGDAALISRASSQVVIDALREVGARASTKRVWLGPGHQYRGNVTALLNKSLPRPNHATADYTPVIGSLAQYIACSTFLHAFDGWNYLARAFDALLSGERRIAVHLAYYAELRAAMSLLATQGIGIFDKRHVGLESRSSALYYNGGTHYVCWRLLRSWARTARGTKTLLDTLKTQNVTLNVWLDRATVGPMTRGLVAEEWLAQWSLDLKRFNEDQAFRNEVSYRPDGVRWPDQPDFLPDPEMSAPIIQCWEALKPSTPGTADLLDSHLLREALRLAYKRDKGRRPSGRRFNTFIGGLAPDAGPTLRDFLSDTDPPHSLLVDSAEENPHFDSAVPVVSRAVLLLRLASAFTSDVLHNAGVNLLDANFWWSKRVNALGLWSGAAPLSDFLALWPEVELGLESVEAWKIVNPPPRTSRNTMTGLRGILAITQFQRAGLWLFAS